MLARNEIFGLQFLAAAWRVFHPKMGQPFMPRPTNSHLLSAILGRHALERMNIGCCEGCSEQVGIRFGRTGFLDPTLDPNLGKARTSPICEQAHAVCAREDLIKIVPQLS